MASKRFRTRRQWTNTILWGIVSFFMVVVSVAISGMMGDLLAFRMALVIGLLGSCFSLAFDHPKGMTYMIDGEVLVIRQKGATERIHLSEINDSTLLDRRAARNLIMEKLRSATANGASKAEVQEAKLAFTRWCTVDIGMKTYTFGIGRDLIDKRPDAKQDLILLRLADGRMMLLSPVYNQDMVVSLNRTSHLAEQDRRRA